MGKWNWKMASLGVVTSMSIATVGFAGPVKTAVSSIDAQPYLQIHLTAKATGMGASAVKSARVINALSFDVDEQSTSGASIATSTNHVNERIDIKAGESTVATLISVGENLYVNVDISGLSKIPGVTLSRQELASAQLLFGGRWFEFPSSLILKNLPKTGVATAAQLTRTKLIKRELITALTKLLGQTQFTTSANGVYSKSGTISSVWDALAPILRRAGLNSSAPTTAPAGTYTATLTTSGATASGATLDLALQDGKSGHLNLNLAATFEHAVFNVAAPSGATVVTSAMLSSLLGLASNSGTTTLG